ncbi:RDD family protein [Williamsia sp. CHRR-6]|nr:RDD family protein [Williamsia sp. CHRR-6]
MRLVARIIDSIIVYIPTFIISFAAGVGVYASNGSGVSVGLVIALSLVLAVAASAYYVLMEAKTGSTVGKKVLGLKVVGPAGGNPSISQAALRFLPLFLAGLVTGVLGILGFLVTLAVYIALGVTISQSPSKQGFHDRMAGGTQVVRTR